MIFSKGEELQHPERPNWFFPAINTTSTTTEPLYMELHYMYNLLKFLLFQQART